MWSAAAVLACALTMLGRSERHFHPINLVETAPRGASRNVEAFVTRNPDVIHIVTSAAMFQEVVRYRYECGPRAAVAKVASLLVHEEWHLQHGADEREAYSAQLTALAALGFDESSVLYGGVKRSMLARLAKPPQIARMGTPDGQR